MQRRSPAGLGRQPGLPGAVARLIRRHAAQLARRACGRHHSRHVPRRLHGMQCSCSSTSLHGWYAAEPTLLTCMRAMTEGPANCAGSHCGRGWHAAHMDADWEHPAAMPCITGCRDCHRYGITVLTFVPFQINRLQAALSVLNPSCRLRRSAGRACAAPQLPAGACAQQRSLAGGRARPWQAAGGCVPQGVLGDWDARRRCRSVGGVRAPCKEPAASGMHPGETLLWRLDLPCSWCQGATRKASVSLQNEQGSLASLSFSPDGQSLAVATGAALAAPDNRCCHGSRMLSAHSVPVHR